MPAAVENLNFAEGTPPPRWFLGPEWFMPPPDAWHFEFGMQLIDQGAAWIDNISMDFEDAAK